MQNTLFDYLGQQNEIANGIKPKPEDTIQKPEALVRYEMAKSLQVPYISGGLYDQPFIFIMEHKIVEDVLIQWRTIELFNERMKKGPIK